MGRSVRMLRLVAPLLALSGAPSAHAADPPAASAPNPCALLDGAEVGAALGRAVEPGRPIDNGITADGAASRTCLWLAAAAPDEQTEAGRPFGGRPFAILNVMEWPGPPGTAGKFLESFRKSHEAGVIAAAPVPVEVGADEALWWGDGVAGRRGAASFGVSVAAAGDRAQRRPRAEALARLIAARLPTAQPPR